MSTTLAPPRGPRSEHRPALLILDRPDRGEAIRVAIDAYDGHEYVSIGNWFRDGRGELRPTRQQLSIRRRELARLILTLQEAAKAMDVELYQ